MSYGKYFYQNKNENEDISIHPNKAIKQEYNNCPISSKNKSNEGIQTILNYQNKSSSNIDINENIQNSNYYVSSSLKDQILSPGDDDISPNFGKNKMKTSNLSNYLDDDIIFNQLNYHYLNKPNNPFSLINNQSNQSKNYTNFNIKNNNKKTLILDLDETLVHSSFKPINYNNVMHKPDIFLNIDFRGNNHNVYVLKRPYVHEFLKEMNKIYNIIIFTASVKEYANPLLDSLDTEKVIKKRLFREDCCIGETGKYIKDLKVLNMNLKDLILVDNNPISYSYNICNGVPIKTWHYDKTDQELIKLIPVLQFLSNVNDVRNYIPKLVENDEIDFKKINLMINELNNCNEPSKYIKSRAKSQKRYLPKRKDKRNNSINYGYTDINNTNLDIKIRQRLIYEESKINLEIYNKINKKNNDNKNDDNNFNLNNNTKIIKNTNLNKDFNNQENKKEFVHKDNNFEFENNIKYNYNNYLLNNDNMHNKNNNITSEISKKEKNRDSSSKAYLKNNNNTPSIKSYCKKKYLNENIYTYNNNYLNNEDKNHTRNKSQNYNYIIKDKKEIQNIGINNCKNIQTNLYKNIRNNNLQFLNENINKFVNDDRIDNRKKNFLFNYEEKLNNGYITPQSNNKYTSNYSIHPLSTKNNNTNMNINNEKHLSFNSAQGNNDKIKGNKNTKEKYYMNNNNINGEIEKNNSSNYIRFYKELNKNDYKYNYLKKSVNNFELPNNRINSNKEINNNIELNHIYNNTVINFYQAKANNSNNKYSYLNSNSNLNINLNNLYNKEKRKINNIINKEKTDEKFDNNIKKHNSPYQISKETNYYIKRRMKLNKEKLLNKKKEKENNLYVSFNNQKERKENFLINNNYFYNIQQRYFNNERENFLYVNKKY